MKNILSHFSKRQFFIGVTLIVIFAGGFYYASGSGATHAEVPANTAIPVVVQTLTEQKIRVWSDFSGRLQAVDAAEIRPQVSGRVVAVNIDDGQIVRAGDVLFIIDPRPFEAAVAKAEADLASAITNADFAKTDF